MAAVPPEVVAFTEKASFSYLFKVGLVGLFLMHVVFPAGSGWLFHQSRLPSEMKGKHEDM